MKTGASGDKYLVEPHIRDFKKFTSNTGWIEDSDGDVLALEAFVTLTTNLVGVCLPVTSRVDTNPIGSAKAHEERFELTDPAICSRKRQFGPTDLGEKGIESFFANHQCNEFCNHNGRWQRPRQPRRWFAATSATSMFSSSLSHKLTLRSTAMFKLGFDSILEAEDSDEDSGGW